MLINKLLAAEGYIFVKNVDLQYIKMLMDLGSYPIFINIEHGKRIITVGIGNISYQRFLSFNPVWHYNYILNDFDPFNLDCCSISEIKRFLVQANFDDIVKRPTIHNVRYAFFVVDYPPSRIFF